MQQKTVNKSKEKPKLNNINMDRGKRGLKSQKKNWGTGHEPGRGGGYASAYHNSYTRILNLNVNTLTTLNKQINF